MDNIDYAAQWKAEEECTIKGWDFSHISGRWLCPDPPWDYRSLVKTYLKDSDILLDMGTGGGEVLLTIGHPTENTYATEAYPPNLELCRQTLSPLGITIAQTFPDDQLPFDDATFDFVINRHESFDLNEVARVLKRGGYFVTQQVGNQNSVNLRKRFIGDVPYHPLHTVGNHISSLQQLGFQIIASDEIVFSTKFFDVGAFVFYAKTCMWEFPGFSVEKDIDELFACQKEIDAVGYLAKTDDRFMIVARKG